jgi:hypothetical protein
MDDLLKMDPISTFDGGFQPARDCFYGGTVNGSTIEGSRKIVSCLDAVISSLAKALTNSSVTAETLTRPWNMESLFGSFYASLLIPFILVILYFACFLGFSFIAPNRRDARLRNGLLQFWLFVILTLTCALMKESVILSDDDVYPKCFADLTEASVSPSSFCDLDAMNLEMSSISDIASNDTLYPSLTILTNATNGDLQDVLRMRLYYACRTDPVCYTTFRPALRWAGFGNRTLFPPIPESVGEYGICAYQLDDLHPFVLLFYENAVTERIAVVESLLLTCLALSLIYWYSVYFFRNTEGSNVKNEATPVGLIGHVSFFLVLLTFYLWLSAPSFSVDDLHFVRTAPGSFRRVFGNDLFTMCARIKNGVEINYSTVENAAVWSPFCIQRTGNAVLIILCLIWHTLDVFVRFYIQS